MRVACTYCGRELETTHEGVFRETTGWAERRNAGGANAIRPPKVEHDRWAHGACLDNIKRGRRQGQQSLGF